MGDVKPVCPPDAKEAGIQGIVVLDVVVDREGRVSNIEVIKSIPELDQAAIDAVQQWEFERTDIKGKAVSVRMTVTVNFTLA
jgi:periplasmic protein TonB